MLPVEAFSFVDGHADLILDMAAAPGGKTTHLAARAGDTGLIVANDASRRRIRALSSNLRTWGVTSAVITNLQGEELGSQLPGIFDKVLLDAPCSGESLRAGGGSKGRRVSEREHEALQRQQIRMLLSGMDALRVGGELIYATCTAAPAENEAVIDAALQRKKDQFEITSIELLERLAVEPSGLTRFESHDYHSSLSSTVRLWPFHFDTGAFFTARLRRTDGVTERRADTLGGKMPTFIDDNALIAIHDQLAEFGFDLLGECQRSMLVLFKQDRFVHAVSNLWLNNIPDLPVTEAGLPVGRWQGERFLPAHEWVTRYASDFLERIFTLDEEKTQRWLRGSDLRDWKPPVKGGAILLQDETGRFLGVGTVSAQRVRNLLPRSWVAG
jgi:16S rRNA (cytosine1407-C5)-methyltransferase